MPPAHSAQYTTVLKRPMELSASSSPPVCPSKSARRTAQRKARKHRLFAERTLIGCPDQTQPANDHNTPTTPPYAVPCPGVYAVAHTTDDPQTIAAADGYARWWAEHGPPVCYAQAYDLYDGSYGYGDGYGASYGFGDGYGYGYAAPEPPEPVTEHSTESLPQDSSGDASTPALLLAEPGVLPGVASLLPPDMAHAACNVLWRLGQHGPNLFVADCASGEWSEITPRAIVAGWLARAVATELEDLRARTVVEIKIETPKRTITPKVVKRCVEFCQRRGFVPARLRWALADLRAACAARRPNQTTSKTTSTSTTSTSRPSTSTPTSTSTSTQLIETSIAPRRAVRRMRVATRQSTRALVAANAMREWRARQPSTALALGAALDRLRSPQRATPDTRPITQRPLRRALAVLRRCADSGRRRRHAADTHALVQRSPRPAVRRWCEWSRVNSQRAAHRRLVGHYRTRGSVLDERSRCRRGFFLWRLRSGRLHVARLCLFQTEFGSTSDQFRDAFLGVDQAMLTPGLLGAFRACARLWRRVVQRPGTCGCAFASDERAWLRHTVKSSNQLLAGVRSGACANGGPQRGRHSADCYHSGCHGGLGEKKTQTRCAGCGLVYCSAKCHQRHHDARGHDVCCGLGSPAGDAFLGQCVAHFGRWLSELPADEFPYGPRGFRGPIESIMSFVSGAAVQCFLKGRELDDETPPAPIDFMHPTRVRRAAHRAELVLRLRPVLRRPDGGGGAVAAAAALAFARGQLATRDVMDCVAMAMFLEGRARLVVSSQPEHAELARQMLDSARPLFWVAQELTRRAYDLVVADGKPDLDVLGIRRVCWGKLSGLVGPPASEFFRSYFFVGTEWVEPRQPMHPADSRRGYGTVATRVLAAIAVEGDVLSGDDMHRLFGAADFVQVGGRQNEMLKAVREIVQRQFPGYPSCGRAWEPVPCLSRCGDPDVRRQLQSILQQQQLARNVLAMLELIDLDVPARSPPPPPPVPASPARATDMDRRRGLWRMLSTEPLGDQLTDRAVLGVVRTALYSVGLETPQVACLLSRCFAALSWRNPLARAIAGWRARLKRAIAAGWCPIGWSLTGWRAGAGGRGQQGRRPAYWMNQIFHVESAYPHLGRFLCEQHSDARFWAVVYCLGDAHTIRRVSQKCRMAARVAELTVNDRCLPVER